MLELKEFYEQANSGEIRVYFMLGSMIAAEVTLLVAYWGYQMVKFWFALVDV